MSEIRRRRVRAASIPFGVKEAIWRMPCAVCGIPYDINVDHIVPVARGGTSERSNLQPLCHACNHIKGCRLTNVGIASVVKAMGEGFFSSALYREATRFANPYGGETLAQWLAADPTRKARAGDLLAQFLSRWPDA